jgi:hypothetical protein
MTWWNGGNSTNRLRFFTHICSGTALRWENTGMSRTLYDFLELVVAFLYFLFAGGYVGAIYLKFNKNPTVV